MSDGSVICGSYSIDMVKPVALDRNIPIVYFYETVLIIFFKNTHNCLSIDFLSTNTLRISLLPIAAFAVDFVVVVVKP